MKSHSINTRQSLMIGIKEGRELLEHPERFPSLPLRHKQILRLWSYPSFEPNHSWNVYREIDGTYVRRVTLGECDRSLRYLNVGLFGSEALVPTEIVDSIFCEVLELNLQPMIFPKSIYLDGDSYGFELARKNWTCRLTWHDQVPQEWSAIARWHARTIDLLTKLLPVSMTSFKDRP